MKHSLKSILLGMAATLALSSAADAALISASGGPSSLGAGPSIIAAPADVRDDAAWNEGIQGFNEAIGVVLGANLAVDGGSIAAGTRVDSHMIFLNSGPGNNTARIEHGAGGNRNAVSFSFDGNILGVMSNSNGSLEVASSGLLGAPGTIYPVASFAARGMEDNPLDGDFDNDWYAFSGNTIRLGMIVTEPGDWIRVVTVSAVPLPAAGLMLPIGLGALAFARRRRKKTS